jgi:hypothetical protein
MKLIDYLNSGLEIDADMVIGDVDMPYAFVWDKGCGFTDYGLAEFSDVLNSECVIHKNGCIEVFYDDCEAGEYFTAACAGFIADSEFQRLFNHS